MWRCKSWSRDRRQSLLHSIPPFPLKIASLNLSFHIGSTFSLSLSLSLSLSISLSLSLSLTLTLSLFPSPFLFSLNISYKVLHFLGCQFFLLVLCYRQLPCFHGSSLRGSAKERDVLFSAAPSLSRTWDSIHVCNRSSGGEDTGFLTSLMAKGQLEAPL